MTKKELREQSRNITSCVVRRLPERPWVVVVVSIPVIVHFRGWVFPCDLT